MATLPLGGTPSSVTFPSIFSTFDRGTIASAVEVLMAVLDTIDSDPDLEETGDDELTGDEADTGWTEYHTRGRHKLALGMSEPFADHEDDEDDDPDTSVEDGSKGFDPEEDFGGEEAGEPEDYSIEAFSDPDALRENRARIRRTRCDRIEYVSPWSHSPRVEFRLKDPPSLNC